MPTFTITYETYTTDEKLPQEVRNLLLQAQHAATNAYSPYSRFHVGAALLSTQGEIFTGNNQENMAHSSGLCAERVAIFAAMAQQPTLQFRALAIRAFSKNFALTHPITPCGACRQVLLEYQMRQKETPITVWMQGDSGEILHLKDVRDLLPFGFFEEKL